MGRKKEQEHKTLARWIIDKTNTDHYRAGMLSGWKHPYIDADVMEMVGGRKQLLDQATILENETNAGKMGKFKPDWKDVKTSIKKIDYDELDSISISDFQNIRNILSTDSITGVHNNVYRDHYILPRFAEEEAPFKVILSESLGIKILNSISSHSSTDLKIKSTFDSLINNLNEVIPKKVILGLFLSIQVEGLLK